MRTETPLYETRCKGCGRLLVTVEQLRPVLTVLWPGAVMVLLTQFIGLYVASALYGGVYMRGSDISGRRSWP